MLRKIKPTTKKVKDFDSGKSKTIKRYPHFRVGLKHLPEAEKWPIEGNKTYFIKLEVDMTGIEKKEKKEEEGMDALDMEYMNQAEFNIVGIEVLPETGGSKSSKKVSRRKV